MPTSIDLSYLQYNQTLNPISITNSDIIDYPNNKKRRKVYENVEYDQQQHNKIKQYRNYAKNLINKTNIMNIQQIEDKHILRYLYSTDFNIQQCHEKILIFLQWYSNQNIQKFDNKTLKLINSGLIYTYGRDKYFRPVIYLNVSLMDMSLYALQDYLSAINTIINITISHLFIKGKIQSYTFIIDTGNKNFTSLPLNTVKQIIVKLSYVYSMRMGKLFVINCNYLIKLMYKAIQPFLTDITRQKIKLFSTSDIQEGKLREFIDINEMQQKYGGFRQNLKQKWPPKLPGKKNTFKNTLNKQLKQYDFDNQNYEQIQIMQSEYYSIDNHHNEQFFVKHQYQELIIQDSTSLDSGCCATQECCIY